MPPALRCLLVTPISPQQAGNGLAHRCRFWQEVLAELGEVTTVVVPVSGAAHPGDLVAAPEGRGGGLHLPRLARRATEADGRTWWAAAERPVPDLVLALRSTVAGFALGAAAATDAIVVVDLDDDDEALARALGDVEEADRYGAFVGTLRTRARALCSVTGFGATIAVPNSVTVAVPAGAESAGGTAAGSPEGDVVLMVGNFTYTPNERGAAWFVEEVLPRVASAVPSVELRLVGHGSDEIGPQGLGFVAELDPLYATAKVAVVPLLEASGSRIKALEAFAAGVPVVGTTVGLSGIPVTPGVDCLVADEPDELAAAVTRVLHDPALADELAAAGRALVARFDRPVVVADAVAQLQRLLAEPAERWLERAPELVVTEEDDGLVVVDEASMVVHHLDPLSAAVFLLVEDPVAAPKLAAVFADVVEQPVDAVAGAVAEAVSALRASGLVLAGEGPHPH